MLPSFSSSSFIALTTTAVTNDTKASAKVGSEEEAADGTAEAGESFDALTTADRGGSSSSSSSIYIKITQQTSITTTDK